MHRFLLTSKSTMSSVPVMSKNAVKRAAKAARRAEAKRLKRGNACSWEPPATDLLPTVNKRAPGCRRYKATVSYNGADFHGWAPQHPPGKAPLRTVGSVMEGGFRAAIGQRVRVHPAGRTDSGVSAIGQVCQFDAEGTAPRHRHQVQSRGSCPPHPLFVVVFFGSRSPSSVSFLSPPLPPSPLLFYRESSASC